MNRLSLVSFALLVLSVAPVFADEAPAQRSPCSHNAMPGVTMHMGLDGVDMDKARCRLAVDKGAIGQQTDTLLDAQVELELSRSDVADQKKTIEDLSKKIVDDETAAKKTIDDLTKKVADAVAAAKVKPPITECVITPPSSALHVESDLQGQSLSIEPGSHGDVPFVTQDLNH